MDITLKLRVVLTALKAEETDRLRIIGIHTTQFMLKPTSSFWRTIPQLFIGLEIIDGRTGFQCNLGTMSLMQAHSLIVLCFQVWLYWCSKLCLTLRTKQTRHKSLILTRWMPFVQEKVRIFDMYSAKMFIHKCDSYDHTQPKVLLLNINRWKYYKFRSDTFCIRGLKHFLQISKQPTVIRAELYFDRNKCQYRKCHLAHTNTLIIQTPVLPCLCSVFALPWCCLSSLLLISLPLGCLSYLHVAWLLKHLPSISLSS